MNTELMENYQEKRDRIELIKKIQEMSTDRLFSELDDTIQFDIMKISNEKWCIDMNPDKVVYNAIIHELRNRVR